MSRSWAASSSSRSALVATQQRVDRQVVVRVISMVRGGREDRRQVQRRDPEVREVVEPLGDPQEVAALEAVDRRWARPMVRVRPGLGPGSTGSEPVGEDLVEDRVADPRWSVGAHRRLAPYSPRCRVIRRFLRSSVAPWRSSWPSSWCRAERRSRPVAHPAPRRVRDAREQPGARPARPERRPRRGLRRARGRDAGGDRGGATESSTRCSCAASPIPTATASATCAA